MTIVGGGINPYMAPAGIPPRPWRGHGGVSRWNPGVADPVKRRATTAATEARVCASYRRGSASVRGATARATSRIWTDGARRRATGD